MKTIGLEHRLSVANDGAEAVDFLLKRGSHSEAPDPDLVFLDVHLPKATGYEALRQIPNAHQLPICVLTSSTAELDLFRKEFGIEGARYLIKPVSPKTLLDCLRSHPHLRSITAKLSPHA
jgi:CheY-like chemotaxis protein